MTEVERNSESSWNEERKAIKLSDKLPTIIVAYTDKNRYIGKDNDILWGRKLKGDFNFMKMIIRTDPSILLIMGRNTYESIPIKPKIKSVVLSRNKNYNPEGTIVKSSFDEALEYANDNGLKPVIFGGEAVYRDALRHKCKIFSTVVEENNMVGDTKYPEDNAKLENITNKVHEFLLEESVIQTWKLFEDSFLENNLVYRFYVGYN